MSTENQWANSSNNYDDEICIEAYAENADITRDILVDQVVNQVQNELGVTIRSEPHITPETIISMARNRFIDLLNKDLLSEREANKCYQRFAQLVHYYYGTP